MSSEASRFGFFNEHNDYRSSVESLMCVDDCDFSSGNAEIQDANTNKGYDSK
jgi:hypothetical protein